MILVRYKGRYFIEAKNITKEELAEDIAIISVMLNDKNDKCKDIMFSTDLIDKEER